MWKILKKPEIEKYVERYSAYLYVEAWHESKPYFYLKARTGKGFVTIARVPKNIFKWFILTPSTTPTDFINVSWFVFGPEDTPKEKRVTDFNNYSILESL